MYGRGSFTLEDETESVLVEVLGSCYPKAADVFPQDGDRV